MRAVGASEKVFEYIDREPEIRNDGKLAPKGLKGQIEFKNVSFHYPCRPDAQVLKVYTDKTRKKYFRHTTSSLYTHLSGAMTEVQILNFTLNRQFKEEYLMIILK